MTTQENTTGKTKTKSTFLSVIQMIGCSTKLVYLLLMIISGIVIWKIITSKSENSSIEYNSNLIEKQIKNVGKLVVTEGHFSEVLTYKDQKKYLMDFISFEKKALIIVNADVTVSYDLRQIKYDIDEKNKTVSILNIPKEEIKINPNIEYYDVNQSTLNPFTGDDYNKVNKIVRENLEKKIEKSTLKTNAKNRLISELYNILVLTKTMGWKLEYKGEKLTENSVGEVVL